MQYNYFIKLESMGRIRKLDFKKLDRINLTFYGYLRNNWSVSFLMKTKDVLKQYMTIQKYIKKLKKKKVKI